MSYVKLLPYYKRTDLVGRFEQQVSTAKDAGFVKFGSLEMQQFRAEFQNFVGPGSPPDVFSFDSLPQIKFCDEPPADLVQRPGLAEIAEARFYHTEQYNDAKKFLTETENPPDPCTDYWVVNEETDDLVRDYLLKLLAVPDNIEVCMHSTYAGFYYEFVRATKTDMAEAGQVYVVITNSEVLSIKTLLFHGALMRSLEDACRETRLTIRHKGLTPTTKRTFIVAATGLRYEALEEHFASECLRKIDMEYMDLLGAAYRPSEKLGFDLEEDREFYCECCCPGFETEEDRLAWEKRRDARLAYLDEREFDLPSCYTDQIMTTFNKKTIVLTELDSRKSLN